MCGLQNGESRQLDNRLSAFKAQCRLALKQVFSGKFRFTMFPHSPCPGSSRRVFRHVLHTLSQTIFVLKETSVSTSDSSSTFTADQSEPCDMTISASSLVYVYASLTDLKATVYMKSFHCRIDFIGKSALTDSAKLGRTFGCVTRHFASSRMTNRKKCRAAVQSML